MSPFNPENTPLSFRPPSYRRYGPMTKSPRYVTSIRPFPMTRLRVHVFGPPEDGHMPMDERLCEEPDDGELVVYHAGVIRVIDRGRVRLLCRECDASSMVEEDERMAS